MQLHRYFADREQLLEAAVEDSLQALGQSMEDAALDQGPPPEAIRRLVAAMVGAGDRLLFLFGDPRLLQGRVGADADGPAGDRPHRARAGRGGVRPRGRPRLGRVRPLGAGLHRGRGGQQRAAAPVRRHRHRDPHPRERHPRPEEDAMTTLVTGASGTVGRSLVEQLARAGEPVRAMTRDPAATRFPAGVEVVHGDLADPGTLAAALAGADRLHLFPYPATAREVVDLAGRAGLRRVTVLSSGSVTAGFDTDYQLPVEQAVEASGLEWTHLRPGEFAANRLALWGPSIRAERVVRWPYPDEVGIPIHEADIAAVAVYALLEDGLAGRATTLPARPPCP